MPAPITKHRGERPAAARRQCIRKARCRRHDSRRSRRRNGRAVHLRGAVGSARAQGRPQFRHRSHSTHGGAGTRPLRRFRPAMVKERGVRPTALEPIWRIAGFRARRRPPALMGEKAAMACTVAVEEVIDGHYGKQIRSSRRKRSRNCPRRHQTIPRRRTRPPRRRPLERAARKKAPVPIATLFRRHRVFVSARHRIIGQTSVTIPFPRQAPMETGESQTICRAA